MEKIVTAKEIEPKSVKKFTDEFISEIVEKRKEYLIITIKKTENGKKFKINSFGDIDSMEFWTTIFTLHDKLFKVKRKKTLDDHPRYIG